MRLKRDYMGNDQLLPAYNLQAAICDVVLCQEKVQIKCNQFSLF